MGIKTSLSGLNCLTWPKPCEVGAVIFPFRGRGKLSRRGSKAIAVVSELTDEKLGRGRAYQPLCPSSSLSFYLVSSRNASVVVPFTDQETRTRRSLSTCPQSLSGQRGSQDRPSGSGTFLNLSLLADCLTCTPAFWETGWFWRLWVDIEVWVSRDHPR